jgi:hypothetical protein
VLEKKRFNKLIDEILNHETRSHMLRNGKGKMIYEKLKDLALKRYSKPFNHLAM